MVRVSRHRRRRSAAGPRVGAPQKTTIAAHRHACTGQQKTPPGQGRAGPGSGSLAASAGARQLPRKSPPDVTTVAAGVDEGVSFVLCGKLASIEPIRRMTLSREARQIWPQQPQLQPQGQSPCANSRPSPRYDIGRRLQGRACITPNGCIVRAEARASSGYVMVGDGAGPDSLAVGDDGSFIAASRRSWSAGVSGGCDLYLSVSRRRQDLASSPGAGCATNHPAPLADSRLGRGKDRKCRGFPGQDLRGGSPTDK